MCTAASQVFGATEDIEIDGTVSLQTEECLVHRSSLLFGSSVPMQLFKARKGNPLGYCKRLFQFKILINKDLGKRFFP